MRDRRGFQGSNAMRWLSKRFPKPVARSAVGSEFCLRTLVVDRNLVGQAAGLDFESGWGDRVLWWPKRISAETLSTFRQRGTRFRRLSAGKSSFGKSLGAHQPPRWSGMMFGERRGGPPYQLKPEISLPNGPLMSPIFPSPADRTPSRTIWLSPFFAWPLSAVLPAPLSLSRSKADDAGM